MGLEAELRMSPDEGTRAPTYEEVAREFAAPLERLVRGYEADAERQRDLLQEIHVAIWRGLPSFDGRASLRTWLYRVAHNVAVSHVIRGHRLRLEKAIPIEGLEEAAVAADATGVVEQRDAVARLAALVRRLRPADRQLILLYLEGFDHGEIATIAGISPENAATKVHRIKRALAGAFQKGGSHVGR
jgi:RNA polymerase sigma-70 factor (ECF subfamily)